MNASANDDGVPFLVGAIRERPSTMVAFATIFGTLANPPGVQVLRTPLPAAADRINQRRSYCFDPNKFSRVFSSIATCAGTSVITAIPYSTAGRPAIASR